MINLPKDFIPRVLEALNEKRKKFDGSDEHFAKQLGFHPAVYNQIKNGKLKEGLVSDAKWLEVGRKLDIASSSRKWNMVRTSVFSMIEQDILFCQKHSKSRICVDDTGIGKTFSAKYLSNTLKHCFYLDASQCKTKQQFIRNLAQIIGVDSNGKYIDVKANLKYYLKMISKPIIIIDEAGDLEYTAFLELKELWNATEGLCGWYMIGADGLRDKIRKGISNKKVGYREMFSRYSEKYTQPVPVDRKERQAWYKKLITDVLSANMTNKSKLSEIVNRCIVNESGEITGLRRAESLVLIFEANK